METTQKPDVKLGSPPFPKKKKWKNKGKWTDGFNCILCRRACQKHAAHQHLHSMQHHKELDSVMDKGSFHECQACNISSMDLKKYAQHICTTQHQSKLMSLVRKNVKPLPLEQTLDKETMDRILERNKKLKTQKNAMKRQRRKLRQEAAQQSAMMLQGEGGRYTAVSSEVMEESKPSNLRIPKWMQETNQQENNNAMFPIKENKTSSLQRTNYQREFDLLNQGGRLKFLSGEPEGQTGNQPDVRHQFTQSDQQMRFNVNFSVHNQGGRVKTDCSQTDQKPNGTQGGTYNQPEQQAWPVHSQTHYFNQPYTSGTDGNFTSDLLPHSGAIIFDQQESLISPQPGQEGSHTNKSASANRSEDAAPVRSVDVTSMLRQIRRALGVREPCRADREARRQNGEMVLSRDDKEQQAGSSFRTNIPSAAATSEQSIRISSPPPSLSLLSNPATSKQGNNTVTKEMAQQHERSLMVDENSNRRSNRWDRESQVALLSWAPSSKPNTYDTQKARIAREPAGNLFQISGSQSKPSWRQMYNEMKRKKLEKVKGKPRFGIRLRNNAETEQPRRGEDLDMPLSEGFHWESIPVDSQDSPTASHCAGLSTALHETIVIDCNTETQSDSSTQEPLEKPDAAQEGWDDQMADVIVVDMKPNSEDQSTDLESYSGANKRKPSVEKHDDVSDEQQSGKKKRRTKSPGDQDPMDELLTVSLREDELSRSLQDLEKSLDQARISLQLAYTEVQRLLLIRQQCTAEVNSLRAKRIEILQGMQGGHLRASIKAEKVDTSSTSDLAAMQQRLSPLPSSGSFPTTSSQQPPLTNLTSPIIQPHTNPPNRPANQVKEEVIQQCTVSCCPDTPQTPVNPPQVPFSPSNLPPSVLLTSPNLAPPTSTASSSTQLQKESITSATTSPKCSPRLQRKIAQEGLKETVQKVSLVIDEQEEDSAREHLPAAQSTSTVTLVEDKGDESDDSIQMIIPSNGAVINIDELENEEDVSEGSVKKQPPEKSVSVEFSPADVKKSPQNNTERNHQCKAEDTSAPAESLQVSDDEDPYVGPFMNHTGAVLGLQIHEGRLYTCSGDNSARAYSLMNNECQAVFEGHTNKVNCLLVASLPNALARLYTGSSDETIRCYNIKTSKYLDQISLSDRVLCLHAAWNILFAGLANGSVVSYDLKTLKLIDVFECHGPRGVSCLGTAQEGARRVLLVGSYDSTISVRDARSGLLLRTLKGHTKTVLCMKVVNDLVFSGSSDTSVHAYNIHTGELVRIYKGHGHAVTSIVILGKVMVTASLDQLIRVYELQSHDRLQVYGGHTDMVMCMAVHKSVIYTGCYDGSVQAVKLNLIKNFRCWWQNCSLIFGIAEHLVQHLLRDHTNPNLQMVKCRWRTCSKFFSPQQAVKQELPEHMKSHVEKDSEV